MTMDRKVVFVVNPKSANGETGKVWRSIAEKFRSRIGDFGELFTSRPMEAAELTRRSLEGGADVVVAVGGDGTTNEVVNGFFAGGKPVRPGAALAVLPRGTGGDFPKTFKWANTVDSAVARLSAMRLEPLDAGRIRYTSHDGKPEERFFVNIASCGTSGLVDRYVNRSSKALGGKLSFMIASTRAMLAYKDLPIQVRFDDGPWEELSITCLAVANGQYFGGGMWVAPEARPNDGTFDVTIWSGFSLADFAIQTRKIYDGRHVQLKGTRVLRARKVEALCDQECLLDIDGEAPGRLPATWEILPGALKVVA